jgi:hypothetical protein
MDRAHPAAAILNWTSAAINAMVSRAPQVLQALLPCAALAATTIFRISVARGMQVLIAAPMVLLHQAPLRHPL